MQNKNIEIVNHGGLVCDNPNCDWEDKTIGFDTYESWIDKPCPKCGENVLTQEDFLRAQVVMYAAELANTMTPEELAEMASQVDFEALKEHPFFSENNRFRKLVKR